MFQATQLTGFGAYADAAPGGFSATYIGTNSSTANASVYDMGDFVFPAEGLAVVLVVANGAAGARTTTLTIGGGAASVHVDTATGPRSGAVTSLHVSAGTLNVTVTFSGNQGRCAVYVYLLAGLVSETISDSQGLDASAGSPVTSFSINSVTVPSGGVGLYACIHANNNLHTWTGATEQTAADYTLETDAVSSALSLVNGTVTPSWTTAAAAVAVGASWA
jgi:hypothetical protein